MRTGHDEKARFCSAKNLEALQMSICIVNGVRRFNDHFPRRIGVDHKSSPALYNGDVFKKDKICSIPVTCVFKMNEGIKWKMAVSQAVRLCDFLQVQQFAQRAPNLDFIL